MVGVRGGSTFACDVLRNPLCQISIPSERASDAVPQPGDILGCHMHFVRLDDLTDRDDFCRLLLMNSADPRPYSAGVGLYPDEQAASLRARY